MESPQEYNQGFGIIKARRLSIHIYMTEINSIELTNLLGVSLDAVVLHNQMEETNVKIQSPAVAQLY